MKEFLQKYKHAWVALYGLIYLPWFLYLEATVTTDYNLIYSPLDDIIPFCEYFIIPYYLWFLFIAITCVYFFFTSTQDYYKYTLFLIIGMTLFLIISTVYPNGHNLRPSVYPNDNHLTQIVMHLHTIDTPTNILPSIHVYNSLAAYAAIYNSPLRQRRLVNLTSLVLTILIIMSTVFLKQHSIHDITAAFIIAIPTYYFIYIRGDSVKK